MSDAKFVAPRSHMEGTVGRLLLGLNTALFLWAVVTRMWSGDAPDHSTGFVFLTGSLFAQSLRDFVSSARMRLGLLIAAGALMVAALVLIAGRGRLA
jgi:hypothetical protein